MKRVRLLRQVGRRRLAGADRPDRLVGDHELLVLAGGEGDRLDLDLEHELGVARLALLERLADAGDHAEPGFERRPGAPGDALVGLAEELAPLRVPDERALRRRARAASAARPRPCRRPLGSQCTFWA